MTKFEQTLSTAESALIAASPRAGYALDVLRGRQLWSGADLKGNAKKFGASYAGQRVRAAYIWRDAGGIVAPSGDNGKRLSFVQIGIDDFGNGIYQSRSGSTWVPNKSGKRLV
jgi:hypothetical protein